MDKLIELRDEAQVYVCACIAKVYREMGSYGPEWGALKHLFNVMSVWSILDQEVTRLTEEE